MTEPVPVTLDDELVEQLRREALSNGKSLREFLREKSRPRGSDPDWIASVARRRLEASPPKSLEEQMQSMMQLQMYRQFFGGFNGSSAPDPRALADTVADAVDRALERRLPKSATSAPSSPTTVIQETMMPILSMKLMMKMVGDDKDPLLQQIVSNLENDIKSKMTSVEASNKELKDTLSRREMEAAEERRALEMEALNQRLGELSAQIHNQPPPPRQPTLGEGLAIQAAELQKANDAFKTLRASLGGPDAPPQPKGVDLDTIERGLNMASDLVSKTLTSAGQYKSLAEGRNPVPLHKPTEAPTPPAQGNYPSAPPGAAPAPPPQAPPPSPSEAPAAAAPASPPAAPAPYSAPGRFPPGTRFIDPATNEEVSESLFLEKYGGTIDRSPGALAVHAERPTAPAAL